MKTLVLALLALLALTCSLRHGSASALATNVILRPGCCPSAAEIRLPKGRVKHVADPQLDCKVKAIVVTTVCNKTLCLNANWSPATDLLSDYKKWVKNPNRRSARFNQQRCSV